MPAKAPTTAVFSPQRNAALGALLAAGGTLGTDGYIQEAPFQRGPVDIASNMHSQNGLVVADLTSGPLRLFLRGSGMNEARGNGTPFQTNGTRLWRYATGADWQDPRGDSGVLRLYGSTEHYRQTFSSITNTPNAAAPSCAYRCGETPTKFVLVPVNELGAAAHWTHPFGTGLVAFAGADAHDVRYWDREHSLGSSTTLTNLHDHQRDSGLYGEVLWTHRAWTASASARMDWFQNYDGHQLTWTASAWMPSATQPSAARRTPLRSAPWYLAQIPYPLGRLRFRFPRLSRALTQ